MNTPGKIPPFHEQPDPSGNDLPRSVRRPDSAPSQVDRLSALVHELDNLLDGSLRCVSLAARTLKGTMSQIGVAEIDNVRKQLETACTALERMAGMVHAAMQGRAIPIGSVLDGSRPAVTIAEAVAHAADVMRLAASNHNAVIVVRVDPAIGSTPAGSIYPAVLNAIKNALESIESAGGTGTILVDCHRESGRKSGPGWACIEISDDGAGIPKGVPSSKLFAQGYSRKAEGRGIGLALTRSVVESMGGHAELSPREDRADHRRPGAMLTLRFPLEFQSPERKRA